MRNNGVKLLKRMLWVSAVVPMLLSLSLFGTAPVKIMPLGDSITYGSDESSQAENSSIAYRGPLWTKLAESEYNVDFVGSQTAGSDYQATDPSFDLHNEGHNAYTADDIDSEVTGYLTANPADFVLLHIGTNDLVYGETIASTVSDVESILDKIKVHNSNPKVIIARIINQKTHDADTTTFNNELNTMVQERIDSGDKIAIVDMEKDAGIDYATEMEDLLHPGPAAYDKMADLWYSALSTVLTPIVPVHLWKLDETAGPTYVDSYSGSDGTCTDPGCPVPVAGQVNGAQEFDGSDEIVVTDTTTFDWAADANVTIEFWMMKSYASTKEENEVIIGRKGQLDSSSSDVWYVGIEHNRRTVAYGVGNRGGAKEDLQYGHGTVVVADSNWNHIAYVITGDTIKIYVNGKIDVDVAREAPGTLHIEGTPVNIGYLNWASSSVSDRFEYIGQLDELTVYPAALSAGLIRQHFENGLKEPQVCDTGKRIKQGTDQCIEGIEPEIPMPYLDVYSGLIQGTDTLDPDASNEPMSKFLPDPIPCTEEQHLVQGSNTCIDNI